MRGIYDVDGVAYEPPKTLRILGIGNSYTRDSLRWVWQILTMLGFTDVVVGHGYIGGSTLAEQYADRNNNAFEYWKYTGKNAAKSSSKSLAYIVANEPWDVVIFQQQSDEAGQYASFVSSSFNINDFLTFVNNTNPNSAARIGLALTWSHAAGYSGGKFISYYGGDPAVQLAAIKSTIPAVADHMTRCDYVVNTGIAIEKGRENEYLNALGVEMLRSDKNHLEYGIPSFMAGLVYVLTVCNVQIRQLSWYPTAADEGQPCTTSAYLAWLAKQCAEYAAQWF